jgi:outer membrane lipoprotein-sorting protein
MMRYVCWAAALLLAVARLSHAASAPASVQPLMERMARAGRAEARVVVTVATVGDSATSRRGTLALEPPDRLRLEYATGGERLTARDDGGEWLQPELRQMLTMSAAQAGRAAILWDLLRSRSASFAERRLGPRTWRLTMADAGAEAESLIVTVGEGRLPAKIETQVGDVQWTIRLSNWRFAAAKGREAFVLRAPAGYEVLVMP